MATNFLCVLVLLAECNPVEKYWIPSMPGECWNTKVRIYSIYVQVAYSVITDLICTLLPIVVLWNVKIDQQLKIAVCGLMSLGLIATACAIVRASSLGIKTVDLSWDYSIAAIWANTELHLGIIATYLPLSRMIYSYFVSQAKSLASSSHQTRGRFGSRNFGLDSRSRRGRARSSNPSSRSGLSGAKGETTCRRASDAGSGMSGISFDPVIKMTTEFHVVQEARDLRDDVNQEQWERSPIAEKGLVRNDPSANSLRKIGEA